MIEWVAGYELRVAGYRLHGSRLAFRRRQGYVGQVGVRRSRRFPDEKR
jgi:hypothetical protein